MGEAWARGELLTRCMAMNNGINSNMVLLQESSLPRLVLSLRSHNLVKASLTRGIDKHLEEMRVLLVASGLQHIGHS